MFNKLKYFVRFIKIEHTLFSLPLIYSGVFLGAKEFPETKILLLVLLAATFARTAAMTLNRIIDAEIDKLNPRTVNREIPAGRISKAQATILVIICLIGYFYIASLFSLTCFLLSPIPIIIFAIYPFLKRFTKYAHFGVGLGLAGAPLGGWLAMNNLDYNLIPAILITVFTILWGTGFDIIYAQLDEEFDKNNNIFSFVSKLGKKSALKYSLILHILSIIMLVMIYIFAVPNILSLIFLLTVFLLFFFVHKYSDNVELAFFKLNSLISFFVFLMIITKDILK